MSVAHVDLREHVVAEENSVSIANVEELNRERMCRFLQALQREHIRWMISRFHPRFRRCRQCLEFSHAHALQDNQDIVVRPPAQMIAGYRRTVEHDRAHAGRQNPSQLSDKCFRCHDIVPPRYQPPLAPPPPEPPPPNPPNPPPPELPPPENPPPNPPPPYQYVVPRRPLLRLRGRKKIPPRIHNARKNAMS